MATTGVNGPFAAGGFTDTNRPTFSGTSAPFAIVQLYARRSDLDATLSLGQAIASGDGHWSLATGPLSPGIYTITAVVTSPGGYPSDMMPLANSGRVVIDTTHPIVVGASSYAGQGRVVIYFRDDLSGMSQPSLLSTLSYTLSGPHLVAFHPLSVSLLPSGGLPTDPQGVVLTTTNNPKLRGHLHYLRIAAMSITDNAGNPLQSDFHVSIATASGRAAENTVIKLGTLGSHHHR